MYFSRKIINVTCDRLAHLLFVFSKWHYSHCCDGWDKYLKLKLKCNYLPKTGNEKGHIWHACGFKSSY